jgi:hypothetical protein
MSAYVEHLIREKLLTGLDAVVNEFDIENLEPIYPPGHPVEMQMYGGLWVRGELEGKLQIGLHPVWWWNETERRTEVMNAIDRRLGKLKEITSAGLLAPIKKTLVHDPPGEIYVSTFYERLP